MARIEVRAGSTQATGAQLGVLGHELGGLRGALGRLEGATAAMWSGPAAAGLADAEDAWVASVTAMGQGTVRAAEVAAAASDAYAQADSFPMLSRGIDGRPPMLGATMERGG